ncbi:hypothetical protein PIB30_093772 [Stylosanthes scabra]|uniref:Uncharacterized protein n=1 Tax=Stylosanthes scabra TaxID=79078 RepID=A0ABU6XUD4_9FABA|nr:hypothetical protein [Stylosanthes scabra]
MARRRRPRTLPFAPDHFVPAVPPPRPAPPRPLPQPVRGVPHRRVRFSTAPEYRCMFVRPAHPPPPPSVLVAAIPDDIPSELSQDLSNDVSDDRETLIEMSQIARYTVRSRSTPCGRTINNNAALTLHPCGRAGIGRMHPEMLPVTREVARGDRATARCPVSHFLIGENK